MAILQSTNVQGALCVNGVAVGGGKDIKFCCFTGSTTWTPSQDLVDGDGYIEAVVVGAGGGSGAAFTRNCTCCGGCSRGNNATHCSAGGGGGSVVQSWYKINATDACTVTIGAGGAGANSDGCVWPTTGNASAGGNTTFGDITSAGGGAGKSAILCCCYNIPGTRCCVGMVGSATLNGGCNGSGGGGGAQLRSPYRQGWIGCIIGTSALDFCPLRYGRSSRNGCYGSTFTTSGSVHYCYESPVCSYSGNNQYCFIETPDESMVNCGVEYSGIKHLGAGGGGVFEECGTGCMGFSGGDPAIKCCTPFSGSEAYAGVYIPLKYNFNLNGNGCCCGAGTATDQWLNGRYKGNGGPIVRSTLGWNNFATGNGMNCAVVNGVAGNDGVVILKWSE